MSQSYTLTYEVPPEMLRRAMTSWTRPYLGRKRRLIWLAVFLLACVAAGMTIGLSGVLNTLSDDMLTGLLIGLYAGLAFCFAMRWFGARKLARLSTDQLAKQGPTTSTFTAKEVLMANDQGRSVLLWHGFDQVIRMADATALRKGAMIYPVPHSALPEGQTPDQFHADLVAWQEAAQ